MTAKVSARYWHLPNETEESIAGKIKLIRLRRNLTQKKLADLGQVSLRTVQAVEYGERVSHKSITKIMNSLDVDVGVLAGLRLDVGDYKYLHRLEITGEENKFFISRLETQSSKMKVRKHLIQAAKDLDLEEAGLNQFIKEMANNLGVNWKTLQNLYDGKHVSHKVMLRIIKSYEDWDVTKDCKKDENLSHG
ncbi:MAG: helix-turn-helix domain-containing protein [Paracoccaceae bacterium]